MMFKSNSGCRVGLALLTIGLCAASTSAGEPASPDAKTASVANYTAPDGERYFALVLEPQVAVERAKPQHHVILVDTSASQFGDHRVQELAVVRSLLANVSAQDRVAIVAVDVTSTALTVGFVSPSGEETAQALSALEQRVPLGATDLHKALASALQSFPADQTGSIVYVGDGMSTAGLIRNDQMLSLLKDLRHREIPVHSYAVGPQTDLELLGVIGQHTGGLVLFDSADQQRDDAKQVGSALAHAVNSTVFYPATIAVDGADVKLLPGSALPMRSDRETIYVGQGTLPDGTRIRLSGKQAGELFTATLTTKTDANDSGNAYLAGLWKSASRDGGLTVPLAGRNMLAAALNTFDANLSRLADSGRAAIATGQVQQAEQIGLSIDRLDPGNVEAKVLIGAANKILVRNVSQQPPAPQLEERAAPQQRDIIAEEEQRRQIRAQKMQLEVSRTIESARSISSDDPDAALAMLRRSYGAVKSTNDIDPDIRQQLSNRLGDVIADVRGQKEVTNIKRIRQAERQAAKEAQNRLVEQMNRDEDKLQDLIDRVRSLLVEGAHGNDAAFEEAEAVADVAVDTRPGNGPATAARATAEAAGQLNNAFRWRALRANRFLQTLEQVEISHVPFPDEPPVRWPPAEVWKAMTERRKKWASVDLHQFSPAEERITSELDKPTELEFIDTPLQDCVLFLAELHNIPIIIDAVALSEEGIAVDEPINRILSGITLRSAMRIILTPLGLTYVIEDEVMKITTEIAAEEILSTRVYPVGDLVIPIQTPQGGGIGGGGQGGQGGIGGGGGGQGGGQGGGGGFGGGGGGFFSVAPPVLINNPQPKKVKQAPVAAPAKTKPQAKKAADPEVQRILDDILGDQASAVVAPAPQAFAQVKDPLPKQVFRFDNESLQALKKKPAPRR